MGKRVTIILDDDLVKKVHDLQSKQIKDTSESVSFSRVINGLIKKCFK